MESLKNLITPTIIFCLIVVVGYFVGKIKVFSVSLDISAVLIVAIVLGYILSKYFSVVFDTRFEITLNQYSKLGTALFASAIGITSGQCINKNSIKRSIMCFFLGAVIVCASIITAAVISLLDKDLNKSVLLGILCGALTSTPGLAAVCEMENIAPELATIGYGLAYLFGVIGVVLFVQIFTRKTSNAGSINQFQQVNKYQGIECLVIICMVSILGQAVGSLKVPIMNFSLGTTGGIVICGILAGVTINKYPCLKNKMGDSLRTYQSFGLILFLVGNGVSAGKQINFNLELKWFVYGVVITLVCLISGGIIGRIVFKKNIVNQMAMVAGAMTSTPAVGVVIKKTTEKSTLATYSLTYLGALVSILLWIKVLCAYFL